MKVAFWSLVLLSIYSYALFPILIYAWSRIRPNPWRKEETFPSFSIVISVHNEEEIIAEKIRNALSLDYPAERMEVIVSSDGSTDKTVTIVSQLCSQRVRLFAFGRSGKTACLNRVVPAARHDILLFTDANAMFPPDLLTNMAQNFADDRVGLVTGSTRYYEQGGERDATGIYSKFEQWTKHGESQIASCVGADGAVFALRRNLYVPLPGNNINDFIVPLTVIEQGYRVVMDTECYCLETASEDEGTEFRRQVRISNRTLWAIFRNVRFINPFRFGAFSFFFISHKMLRFGVPIFFLSSAVINCLLLQAGSVYFVTLIGYVLFLLLGVLNYGRITRDRLSSLSKLFLLTLSAQMLGIIRMLAGIEDQIWNPERLKSGLPTEKTKDMSHKEQQRSPRKNSNVSVSLTKWAGDRQPRMVASKPRVLILIATDIIGGPGKGLLQFLKYADPGSFDYILCSYDRIGKSPARSDFLKKAGELGIPVHRLSQHLALDPTLVPKAGKLIKAHSINLIQTHGYKSNILGFLLKKRFRVPWIAFAHGYTRENEKVKLYNMMDRLCYRFADHSVVVSNSLRELLLQNGVRSERITKIQNAVDPKELSEKMDPFTLKRSLKIYHGAKVLGVVGRLSPEKGQVVFLNAFKRIVRHLPETKALIIGDGPDRERLRSFCSENGIQKEVFFTGHVTNVGDYFRLMDLLVLPSLSEGLPNVLIEAMVLGLPVIASRVGAVGEVLNEMPYNMVQAGDESALAVKIIKFLEDSNLRNEAAKKGQSVVRVGFSPAERAKKIVKLYHRTLSSENKLTE